MRSSSSFTRTAAVATAQAIASMTGSLPGARRSAQPVSSSVAVGSPLAAKLVGEHRLIDVGRSERLERGGGEPGAISRPRAAMKLEEPAVRLGA